MASIAFVFGYASLILDEIATRLKPNAYSYSVQHLLFNKIRFAWHTAGISLFLLPNTGAAYFQGLMGAKVSSQAFSSIMTLLVHRRRR